MTLNRFMGGLFCSALFIFTTACGNSFTPNDFTSNGPATPEPAYYGKPTPISTADAVTVTAKAKFLYRQLSFVPASTSNGLGNVVSAANALAIPFAEFHIYDSAGNRIQQGETLTDGTALFKIPKVEGTYILKVFSRAFNDYIKVSILEDIYANTPYSIAQTFTISPSDISIGSKTLASTVYAQGNEAASAKIEGGAFNIMYNILLANEYIRRNIDKNGDANDGIPSTNNENWWVADKVTVYWKAGFNPYTYFNSNNPLSFYTPGENKLYILGGVNGNVKTADTDHFDDSVILHEYAHFLEDVYGNSQSPGGSHTGNFIIDPRLAWSEGWANYFQGAVLTGADAENSNAAENRLPTNKRFHYYVDTFGYSGSGSYGIGIAFNLAERGDQAALDNVSSDVAGSGLFREVSISRTLYKSTRDVASVYDNSSGNRYGGGVTFKQIWKAFSGVEKGQPLASTSLVNQSSYPIPNMGLFNWLLGRNSVSSSSWDDILTEEKQNKNTFDYATLLTSGTCTYAMTATTEKNMIAGDNIPRSNQQLNNDFYLYYHDGSSGNLRLTYTLSSGSTLNLDLILYNGSYVYFEDVYATAGRSSSYIARQSRNVSGSPEEVSLNGLPAGYYILNVKVDAYTKNQASLAGTATYSISHNGVQQCKRERL